MLLLTYTPYLILLHLFLLYNLLPQFFRKRVFDYRNASEGMKQILWGLFKKMFIADGCAVLVDDIFANYTDFSGGILFFGALLFAIQIYGDFSGIIFDRCRYEFKTLRRGQKFLSALAGPTCDSFDTLSNNEEIPELYVGDVVYVKNIGAYSSASATPGFNGFPPAKIIMV